MLKSKLKGLGVLFISLYQPTEEFANLTPFASGYLTPCLVQHIYVNNILSK